MRDKLTTAIITLTDKIGDNSNPDDDHTISQAVKNLAEAVAELEVANAL